MGRWQPDAKGRLAEAALELYAERGFESTTVAEIAARAGLTERTFFRHFADKREVLFGGADAGPLTDLLAGAVTAAPPGVRPLDALTAGLEAVAAVLQERRDFASRRQRVIAANAELRERELSKLATWAEALARALRERGVDEPTAGLLAEVGIAIFRVAYQRWLDGCEHGVLSELVRESLGELATIARST
jgi:AcrR family transcriptional regulator